MGISAVLDDLITADAPVQLRLKGDLSPQPIGPGKVTKNHHVDPHDDSGSYSYTMRAPAAINTPGGQPKQVFIPITFVADDVLCIFGEPVMEDGTPAIVTPANGQKPRVGVHVGK